MTNEISEEQIKGALNLDILDAIASGISDGSVGLAMLRNSQTGQVNLSLVGVLDDGYMPIAELIPYENLGLYSFYDAAEEVAEELSPTPEEVTDGN